MQLRNRIAIGIVVFFLSYLIFLFIWIQIKPYYGDVMTQVGTHLAGWTTGLRVVKVEHGEEVAYVTFGRTVMTKSGLGDIALRIKISVSHYTFNVPLTFALVAGLFVGFKWRFRTILEACFILIIIHLLYIYFFSSLQLLYELTKAGVRDPSKFVQFFFQFMWTFTDNMIIRFEPFLVAVYLWLRNRERVRAIVASKRP